MDWDDGRVTIRPEHSILNVGKFEATYSTPKLDQYEGTKYQLNVKSWTCEVSRVQECDHDERWIRGTRGNFPYDFFVPFLDADQTEIKVAEGRLDVDDRDNLTKSGRRILYLHVDSTSRPSGLVLEILDGANVSPMCRRVGVASLFGKDSQLIVDADGGKFNTAEMVFGSLRAINVCIK